MVRPSRSAPAWISFFLWGCRSQETISPWFSMAMAAAKDFPPGAAQQSSTFMPGLAPAASTDRREAGS